LPALQCDPAGFSGDGFAIELPLRGRGVEESINVLPTEPPPSADHPAFKLTATHIVENRAGVEPE